MVDCQALSLVRFPSEDLNIKLSSMSYSQLSFYV
jgi:hypothetical protein